MKHTKHHLNPMQLSSALLVLLIVVLSGCSSTPTQNDPAPIAESTTINNPAFVHDPTESYTQRDLHGFTVMISSAAMNQLATTNPALALLDDKLKEIIEITPKSSHETLRTIQFWIEEHNLGFPCACYHPSADWLSENGYNPDKAHGIEITNTTNFVNWTAQDQPYMVLHELAHGFHYARFGYEDSRIEKAYQLAKLSGKYKSVKHNNGSMREHYGLNNQQEYFAELTESYFGKNDFYPFNRDELHAFDHEGFAMIEQMWNTKQNHTD